MPKNLIAVAALITVCTLCPAGTAHAADIVVNRLDDRDGICHFMNTGCSLREAIERSNATTEYDTIYLPAGRIELTQVGSGEDDNHFGDLDITRSVTIVGRAPGRSIVDANSLDRVFHGLGITVIFKQLTITGGSVGTSEGGGAIYVDGGVAIVQFGDLTENESSNYGGGVSVDNGTLWLQDTSIRDNWCAYSGGGIWFDGGASSVLQIDRSTISSNEAATGGAAFFASSGTVQIKDSTISGNIHSDPYFAAVNITSGSQVSMEYGTIVGNSNPSLEASNSATLTLHRTIIQGQCTTSGGWIASYFGNLESPGNTCNLDADGDLRYVTNPMLSPLGSWGGTTETHRPLEGSPAVDHVFPITLPSCSGTIDQRWMERPQDGTNGIGTPCDTGAVELVYSEIFIDGFEWGSTGAW